MESANKTKLVFIICDQGIEPDVMEILQQRGLMHYTNWGNCRGSGETGIRQGTPVWPGLNTVVMVLMDEAGLAPLVQQLHARRDTFPITPGLKLIVTDGIII